MTNAPGLSANVVIAGGGPAGLMCGYLLARAGIDVTVVEKHGDFLRYFRGDTVHPSTMTAPYKMYSPLTDGLLQYAGLIEEVPV